MRPQTTGHILANRARTEAVQNRRRSGASGAHVSGVKGERGRRGGRRAAIRYSIATD